MTEGKHAIIHQLFHEYDIESSNDIQEALVSWQAAGITFINYHRRSYYRVLFTVSLVVVCVLQSCTKILQKWNFPIPQENEITEDRGIVR